MAVIFSILILSLNAFAEGGTESSAGQGTYIPAEQMSPSGSGSSGQSSTAMMQQMLGAGMNAAMGASFAKMCGAPGQQWACPMAAMSFAQAAMMLMSAGQSGDTMDAATGSYKYDPSSFMTKVPGFDEYNVGTNPEALEAFISEGSGNLNNMGYNYDAKTGVMTTPNGEFTVDENMAGSASALVGAAGGSASDMSLAESTAVGLSEKMGAAFDASNLLSKPSVSGVGLNTAGGGGGSTGSGSRSGSSISDYFASLNRKPSSKEKVQMIAGKSKLLGNDNIGISVDNIFAMVHRRYQAKRKSNDFLEPLITKGEKQR